MNLKLFQGDEMNDERPCLRPSEVMQRISLVENFKMTAKVLLNQKRLKDEQFAKLYENHMR